MSSKSRKASRVEVNDLPRKEKELKGREAKQVRGDGGSSESADLSVADWRQRRFIGRRHKNVTGSAGEAI